MLFLCTLLLTLTYSVCFAFRRIKAWCMFMFWLRYTFSFCNIIYFLLLENIIKYFCVLSTLIVCVSNNHNFPLSLYLTILLFLACCQMLHAFSTLQSSSSDPFLINVEDEDLKKHNQRIDQILQVTMNSAHLPYTCTSTDTTYSMLKC